jgi:outer membrane lipoprotein-sorting protein
MKLLQIVIVTLLLILMACNELWAAPGVLEIMKKKDEIEDMEQDMTLKLKLVEHKPDEGVRVLEGIYYRRDQDDTFLLVMTDPNNHKGNGYLRVGENMWMYRRNTRTFQIMKRNQSIAGTDTTAGDLEKRKFTDLYEPALDENSNEIFAEETLGKANIPVYRFEVKAKVKDVKYPKIVYWVRQDNFLTMKEQCYSLSGTLMTTSYLPKYTMVREGKYLPLQIITFDEFEKGEKSILELSGISLEPVDDAVFTKAYLENLSK